MPGLIEAGKVYRAVPPLFGIKTGSSTKYFTTKLEFTKYVQMLFAKNYTLSDTSGRKLTNAETTNLFFKNIEYKDQMDFVSNTFAVDPDMLETVLYYLAKYVESGTPEAVATMAARAKINIEKAKKVDAKTKAKATNKKSTTKSTSKTSKKTEVAEEEFSSTELPVTEGSVSVNRAFYIKPTFSVKGLRSELKKKYRFVDIIEKNGVIRIEGLVNSKYQYVFINDKFIYSCIPLINMIKNNTSIFYRVNGEDVSIYTLMCMFDKMIPAGLTRYKGLGEQNPSSLGVTALRPDGDRTLIRYTIESAKEEIETMRHIDSSMASLLRDVKITKVDIE